MIDKNLREIETKESILVGVDLHSFLVEDIDHFKNTQLKHFLEKEKIIEKELQKVHTDLINYDEKFVADLA